MKMNEEEKKGGRVECLLKRLNCIEKNFKNSNRVVEPAKQSRNEIKKKLYVFLRNKEFILESWQ